MARKARLLYVPVSASFFEDDVVLQAGERATYLYLSMLCRIKQLDSDGLISRNQIARLGVSGWQKRLDDLASVGLVMPAGPSGYLIPSWAKWNELSQEKAERLARDAARKRPPDQADSTRNPDGIQAESVPKQASKQPSKQAAKQEELPPTVDQPLTARVALVADGWST